MNLAVATAPKRNSLHWQLGTITWEELCSWAEKPANKKEAGNYLLGNLAPTSASHPDKPDCFDVHRRKDAVISRSAITLDVDTPEPGFLDAVELTIGWAALIHTTFSSKPESLHYRLIVPTDREMSPDEYIAAASYLVHLLGAPSFDPSTTQPERYMFRPATSDPAHYHHEVFEGPLAHVEDLLVDFERDLGGKAAPLTSRTKRDPFEIEGPVGAFNRAYEDWDTLIETYELPYEKVADDRYHLVGSVSQAGMGPVRDVAGLVFSHHSNDPAYGVTCSAFDLVRLHKFGELDEASSAQTPINKLPSYDAMVDLALKDPRVQQELLGKDFMDDLDDADSSLAWRAQLGPFLNRAGKLRDVIQVWDIVVENDPIFGLLYFNEMTQSPELSAEVPWRAVDLRSAIVTSNDRWEIVHYLEREYGLMGSKQRVDAMIETRAGRSVRNPLREYLDGLVWDKKPRLELCLPGVIASEYTRAVARKSMVAAVARVFDPGCKWDHTLVLFGDEGLGKSWWIDKMSKGFSAPLGRVDNKDTLLAIHRSWIVTADEGHSLRKGDADQLKEFLTRTEDVFRMPYDRETLSHARQFVIWSTTNDETFLRRQEGNRRFLIVECTHKVNFERVTDFYIDQIWAEAVHLYRQGERLFLEGDMVELAKQERERYIEEDALAGNILNYLNTLVPEDWWQKSPEQRQDWLSAYAQGFEGEGTRRIDRVCSIQIWVECLGRRLGDQRRMELLDINNVLARLPGWKREPGLSRASGYGPQRTYLLNEEEELL